MSAVNSRGHALDIATEDLAHPTLFKEDRPRRIDRFISFFGDEARESTDVCGDALLEALGGTRWAD